jgi:hypothetical protein
MPSYRDRAVQATCGPGASQQFDSRSRACRAIRRPSLPSAKTGQVQVTCAVCNRSLRFANLAQLDDVEMYGDEPFDARKGPCRTRRHDRKARAVMSTALRANAAEGEYGAPGTRRSRRGQSLAQIDAIGGRLGAHSAACNSFSEASVELLLLCPKPYRLQESGLRREAVRASRSWDYRACLLRGERCRSPGLDD